MALALGIYNVDALRDALTPEQMAGWIAFWRSEPFGDDWRRSAHMAAAEMNMSRRLAAMQAGVELRPDDLILPEDLLGEERPEPPPEDPRIAQIQAQFMGR